MKVLVVGCGSIGSRHAMNFANICDTCVVDIEASKADATGLKFGAVSFGSNLDKALASRPNGVIIATPNGSHTKIGCEAIRSGSHVLIEKPIGSSIPQVDELLKLASLEKKHVFVVCNMRYHPAILKLKENLDWVGTPLFARAHFGNYLPDMRVGMDYRKTYVADAKEGGAVLDCIHEMDYLTWLFGTITSLMSDPARLGNLEIDAEDYAAIIMKHKSGFRTELHLDFLRRVKRRGCEIVGTHGILDWQSEGKRPESCLVRAYNIKDRRWKTLLDIDDVDVNAPFIKLAKDFFSATIGDPNNLQTGYEARRLLSLSLAARGKPRNAK